MFLLFLSGCRNAAVIEIFRLTLKTNCMGLPKLQTIKENITVKDLIFSGAPTAGTYTGYVNGYLDNYLPGWLSANPLLVLTATVVIFLVIVGILYWVNNETHKKSLAEILANGYFLNFTGKLTALLKQGTEVQFIRSQGNMTVKPGQLFLEIHLPASKSQLAQMSEIIDGETEIAYIETHPFIEPNWWVKIKVDSSSGQVTILEMPRTLFALPNYLSAEYTPATSKKLHTAFNKKFNQLLESNPDKIPPRSRFAVKYAG